MGRGGDGDATPASDKNEVLIDGKLYDVTNFKHPGGTVIKFLTGNGDATEAFNEFHIRSEKAKKILKTLPNREAPADVILRRGCNNKPGLTKDYLELRNQLIKEGFFNTRPGEVVYRLSEILVMHLVGFYLLIAHGNNSVLLSLGLVILGIVQGRCGWLMHEGGHYSMTTNTVVDRMLQAFLYGAGCGMSGQWWRSQHNRHHATPQKLQHDVDLDTLPLLAFNSAILNNKMVMKSPFIRQWLRLQGFLFIPVSCLLVALGWQMFLHPRHIYRVWKRDVLISGIECASMLVRYWFLFTVVFGQFSWPGALAAYLFYDFVGSAYIFTNFSLSHTHLPVSKPDQYLHWVEYAALHTTNISPSWAVNWWMAYLNFQIEHHLFPSMPQVNHPVISPRVRALFEKHGLVYDSRPYFTCLGQTLHNLHTVGNDAVKVKAH